MTTLHEAAQQALEALETPPPGANTGSVTEWAEWYGKRKAAIAALRSALSQQGEQQPVAFDCQTAADFLSGKNIKGELVSRFVSSARWAHDDNRSLRGVIQTLRGELAARDAEIAMLKNALMEAEAAPAPHPDTRTAVQQMVDALEKERPYLGPMPSLTSAAIAAGQKLLKELK